MVQAAIPATRTIRHTQRRQPERHYRGDAKKDRHTGRGGGSPDVLAPAGKHLVQAPAAILATTRQLHGGLAVSGAGCGSPAARVDTHTRCRCGRWRGQAGIRGLGHAVISDTFDAHQHQVQAQEGFAVDPLTIVVVELELATAVLVDEGMDVEASDRPCG